MEAVSLPLRRGKTVYGPPSPYPAQGLGVVFAGLGCDESPRVFMGFNDGYMAIYRRNNSGELVRVEKSSVFVKNYPVKSGLVVDWESLEKYWSEMFSELDVRSEESEVVIIEPTSTSSAQREETIKIMFNKFNISRLCQVNHAATMFAHVGAFDGILVNVGHNSTTITPVIQGEPIEYETKEIPFAGEYMSGYILRELSKRDPELHGNKSPEQNWNNACYVKERCCFVAKDYVTDLNTRQKQSNKFKILSGETIELGDETISCAEFLFNPQSHGIRGTSSLQKKIIETVVLVPDIVPKDGTRIYVILAGGSTLFPGFQLRLDQELKLAKSGRVKEEFMVKADPECMIAPWKGAIKLVKKTEPYSFTEEPEEHPGIDNIWVLKEEFEVVHHN